MAVQLSMVGLIVEDMGRSLAFYRRLGLEIPLGVDDRPHVEVRMEGGLTFFWDTSFANAYDPDREPPAGGYRMAPEFFLASREAVDATYADMTGQGYRGQRRSTTARSLSRCSSNRSTSHTLSSSGHILPLSRVSMSEAHGT